MDQLEPLIRREPPVEELRGVKGAVFVAPEVVCEVEYLEMTKRTKKMRAPVFKGLRPDKPPEDCILEPPSPAATKARR